MYLPLLRGKQFELLALREMADFMSKSTDKISPIIEPVKEIDTTFKKTIAILISKNVNFTIILNPTVGKIKDSANIIQTLKPILQAYSNFQIGFYINSNDSIQKAIDIAKTIDFNFLGFSLIHIAHLDDLSKLKELEIIKKICFNIIDTNRTNKRYHRNFEETTLITLQDCFRVLSKNSDYLSIPEESFSEEHLYYKTEGFIGFSDYLTIGEHYSDGGFMPYAVVIHLTYPDEQNRLKIRHFVSDSNDDSSDIAGKFEEALTKLITWANGKNINSIALKEFHQLNIDKHFPGLGSIKKLSIMHHIETVLKLV